MDKSYYIKLTQAVYRTTDKFPEGEPLKLKIRDKANEILADLVLYNPHIQEETFKAIELLQNYFEVARFQNWTNPLNFVVLEQEYDKVVEQLTVNSEQLTVNSEHKADDEVIVEEKPVQIKDEQKIVVKKEEKMEAQAPKELIDRHKMIIDFLKNNGQAQVWQLKNILPNISKRTIRRDFEYLVKQGLVERIGEKNNTFYRIVEIL